MFDGWNAAAFIGFCGWNPIIIDVTLGMEWNDADGIRFWSDGTLGDVVESAFEVTGHWGYGGMTQMKSAFEVTGH